MDGDWWDFKEAPRENQSRFAGGEFQGIKKNSKRNPEEMNMDELLKESMTIRAYYENLVGPNRWAGRIASPTDWQWIWDNRKDIIKPDDEKRIVELQNEYNKKQMILYEQSFATKNRGVNMVKKKVAKAEVMINPKSLAKPVRDMDYPKSRMDADPNLQESDILGNKPEKIKKSEDVSFASKMMKGIGEASSDDFTPETRFKEKDAPYNPAKKELIPATGRKTLRMEKSDRGDYKIKFEEEETAANKPAPKFNVGDKVVCNPGGGMAKFAGIVKNRIYRDDEWVYDIAGIKRESRTDPGYAGDAPESNLTKASTEFSEVQMNPTPKLNMSVKATKRMEKSTEYTTVAFSEDKIDRMGGLVREVSSKKTWNSSTYGDEPHKVSKNISREANEMNAADKTITTYCTKCTKYYDLAQLKYGRCPVCSCMAVFREKAAAGPEILSRKTSVVLEHPGRPGSADSSVASGHIDETDMRKDIMGVKIEGLNPPKDYPAKQYIGTPQTEKSEKTQPASDDKLNEKLCTEDNRTEKAVKEIASVISKYPTKASATEIASFLVNQYDKATAKMIANALDDKIISPDELQDKLEDSGFKPGFGGAIVSAEGKDDEDVVDGMSIQERKHAEKEGEKMLLSEQSGKINIKKIVEFAAKLKGKQGITNPLALALYMSKR